ncbi:MAG: RIP metalloprotease RseP [Flavobacteriales bacterium]
MEVLIKAAQLILSLSILVVLHELGHFIPAKWFKTRVEKFYLFFDAGFSLFKVKRGETEYGIGWLPLGGYVKIAGMVDESMDTEALNEPAKPWEFRSKPAWQRLIIMLGGVTVNLVLGFVIYAGVLFVYGESYVPVESIPYGLHIEERIKPLGFEDGDLIVALNGERQKSLGEMRRNLYTSKVSEVTVLRQGNELSFKLPGDLGQMLIDSNIREPFAMRLPTVVDTVIAGQPAEAAGLLKGDSIVGVNDLRSPYFNDIAGALRTKPSEEVTLLLVRNGAEMELALTTTDQGTVGFGPKLFDDRPEFRFETETYGFGSAIVNGFRVARETLQGYVLSLRFLFSKAGASQIGSFITIGSIFDASWNWEVFWRTTAFLSLVLAFMNLLPIPALDGGHVVFLLYEIVAGRPAPQKFLEKAQLVGLVILLGLMAFAIGNDVYRWLTNAL